MGIETLVLQRHKVMKVSSEQSELEILSESSQCQNQDCIKESFLSAQNENLQHTSVLLYRLAEIVRENFDEIHIEQKFTATNSRILAGITIDLIPNDLMSSSKPIVHIHLLTYILQSVIKVWHMTKLFP
jgi:hypothetical protein